MNGHVDGRSVLLLGATGLVGGHCLRLLAADDAFSRVVVVTRRPLPAELTRAVDMSRVESHVLDLADLGAHASLLRVDAIVCALGTTIKQAGSQARFREVDFEYPLAAARMGVEQGAHHFLLVSALGADAGSRVFYNRVKGELETAVQALRYRSITIARPSLLLGDRAEFRLGEEVGRRFAFLVPARYKPVHASDVATVLVQAAREDRPGVRVIESAEIRSIAAAQSREE